MPKFSNMSNIYSALAVKNYACNEWKVIYCGGIEQIKKWSEVTVTNRSLGRE